MRRLLLLLAITTASARNFAVNECDVCHKIALYVNSLEGQPYATVQGKVVSASKTYPDAERVFIVNTLVRYNLRKLYLDANQNAKGMTAGTTCADLGFCDVKGQFAPSFPIISYKGQFWDDHSQLTDVRDRSIIVLHHTVDATLQDTISALERSGLSVQYIVDRDGKIYQLVDDDRRAWHAGAGIWKGDGCKSGDTNSRSVGIETVNRGDEPFPVAQVKSIHNLVGYLRMKWHVEPQNIIAHHENSPWQKYDISGYFNWKDLYAEFGEFTGLWKSNLTAAQQKHVVLNGAIPDASLLQEVQVKLFDIGHGGIIVGDPYESSSQSKVTTALAVQSFNRKFCPEVFELEKIVNGNEVINTANQQVYKLTMERLNWLHAHRKAETCTNY